MIQLKKDSKKIKKTVPQKIHSSDVEINDIHKLVHLLQVNQIELEHQNHELRIAEEELEVSRNKYVNLFDFSPIPYFVLDSKGIITEVNINAARMFGTDRRKMIGKLFVLNVASEGKNIFTAFIKSVFNSSAKQSCKLSVMNKDKQVFHVMLEGLKLDATPEADQTCQIALIDLTEYKKLEDSFDDLSEKLAVLKNSKR